MWTILISLLPMILSAWCLGCLHGQRVRLLLGFRYIDCAAFLGALQVLLDLRLQCIDSLVQLGSSGGACVIVFGFHPGKISPHCSDRLQVGRFPHGSEGTAADASAELSHAQVDPRSPLLLDVRHYSELTGRERTREIVQEVSSNLDSVFIDPQPGNLLVASNGTRRPIEQADQTRDRAPDQRCVLHQVLVFFADADLSISFFWSRLHVRTG